MEISYKTKHGTYYNGYIEEISKSKAFKKYKGKVNLIFTSPPFPLNKKKKYGNLNGDEYLHWLSSLAPLLNEFLAKNGSIVMEVGNSWESRKPVMSTLSLKSLIAFQEKGNLELCQQFIWHNTAKLPTPAEWVNVRRIRVKDSFTHIWWLSKTPFPKANNKKVLKEYSDNMKQLLTRKKYNTGKRPSEHKIGPTSFLSNNKGAIPSNVIAAANTVINRNYQEYCVKHKLPLHPARMPIEIPKFFINFLTSKGDLVMDPFGGSNTTGEAAELLGRRWISIEPNEDYIRGSKGRFVKK
jgi:site-specific DNA-methyltransferase (cytosine-N4-specific)